MGSSVLVQFALHLIQYLRVQPLVQPAMILALGLWLSGAAGLNCHHPLFWESSTSTFFPIWREMHNTRNVRRIKIANCLSVFRVESKGPPTVTQHNWHTITVCRTLSLLWTGSHAFFAPHLGGPTSTTARFIAPGRSKGGLTLEISSPATNSCSLQKNMQSVVVKEGGRSAEANVIAIGNAVSSRLCSRSPYGWFAE